MERAKYCVIFISRAYAAKLWTRHELENAQARAFRENREYILPARFDDTELPGMPATVGYVDLKCIPPEKLAVLISGKIRAGSTAATPRVQRSLSRRLLVAVVVTAAGVGILWLIALWQLRNQASIPSTTGPAIGAIETLGSTTQPAEPAASATRRNESDTLPGTTINTHNPPAAFSTATVSDDLSASPSARPAKASPLKVVPTNPARDQVLAQAREYAEAAQGNFTLQFAIICDTSNVMKYANLSSEVWFVPMTIGGRSVLVRRERDGAG